MRRCPASLHLRCEVFAFEVFRELPSNSGSSFGTETILWREARPTSLFHIHLWPIRADAALHLLRVSNAAERSRDHVAVFERTGKLRALVRIVPQEVQQLGEAPLVRIHAAAPLNCFQLFRMGKFGDLRELPSSRDDHTTGSNH